MASFVVYYVSIGIYTKYIRKVEFTSPTVYGKHLRGQLSRFEWKIAICGKTFAIAVLYTYIADGQGHNSQEKIRCQVKNCEKYTYSLC